MSKTDFQKDVLPYLNSNDTDLMVSFKTGFIACIKAVEDLNHTHITPEKLIKHILSQIPNY